MNGCAPSDCAARTYTGDTLFITWFTYGPDGKGNRELGAPNLTDKIWLYGSDEADIIETIANSRNGVMPAWAGRLDPATINALTVYVHTLGGGK